MPDNRPLPDDEIDLFELFETLWNGKWLIVAFIAVASLGGFGYTKTAQPEYRVSVPYSFDVYAIGARQICGNSVGCIEGQQKKLLMSFLDGGWSESLTLTTTNPLNVEAYQETFDQASRLLSSAIYTDAKAELDLIETELTDALLATETIAANALNAKRVIQAIDNGKNGVTFGRVSIEKISPKVQLTIALSVVLGGFLGAAVVLLRNVIRKRNAQLADM